MARTQDDIDHKVKEFAKHDPVWYRRLRAAKNFMDEAFVSGSPSLEALEQEYYRILREKLNN